MSPRWLCAVLIGFVLFAYGFIQHAQARPAQVVSINACTDQLVFALADRDQIAALSTYAADATLSTQALAVRDSGLRLIQGNAEEVLRLKPDLVLAGSFTRRATRNWLAQAGIRVETFPAADSVEATKDAIIRMASLLGHPGRGAGIIAQIDAALAELPPGGARISVLQVQRRGFISGTETLLGDLLNRADLANAAERLGVQSVRRTSLEAIVKLRPDVLIVSSDAPSAADQGSALLLHPVIAARYPPSRRIIMPENLLVCGGPSLPQAIRHLVSEVRRVRALTSTHAVH
jgi:iron complex transport system substrate-binding protein